jgi:hypothetical protein
MLLLAKLKVTIFGTTFVFGSCPKNEFICSKRKFWGWLFEKEKKRHFLFENGPRPPF